ncbi:hypothetical protein [Zunongwangia pacifica]|uniref:NlpE C-terminal OB domain-containing protein n=1 Tax=Zunongwangia pacifica TaxID=2911062 RepID=A0A9X1ZRD9_9FLAO|nr:hypothetical protein [Zunongwangia pacifica]MCL6219642.1 hypothetical protein [Zunongwangia pacifica]
MKKILFIFLLLITIASCKDDTKQTVQENVAEEQETEQDTVPTVVGKFVFTEKDAILRGENFIYNVEIDSLSRNLGKQVEAYKTDDFEMIPVKVKGKLKQSPRQTGIKRNIELREIVAILADSTKNRQE